VKNVRVTILLSGLLIGAFAALAARCLFLQYFRGEYYAAVSTKQQRGFISRPGQRGAILDCRGRVLAASNEVQTIFAEPRLIKDAKETSNELAPIVNIGAHIICKRICESKNPGFVKIAAGAEANQPWADRAARRIRGVGVEHGWQRYYPMGKLASHVVGFTSPLVASTSSRGLAGVELQYDKELAGAYGKNVFFADILRRPVRLSRPVGPEAGPRAGAGIILTIDSTIQQFARAELEKQYKKYQAESAVAVVAEPKTGAILAMVSLPDFDPAEVGSTDPNNLRNRAITDPFEPGSLIKPIVAAIALDAGVVNTKEKIFCENGDYHGAGFGRIGEYRTGFGQLTLREILIHSSNIGMAKIGQRLGKKRLYKGLKLFGFGQKTGIDLPGESPGRLWPPGRWTGYSVTRIPFGHEISVTAIQMVRGFCILANGGHPVRPYVVAAVIPPEAGPPAAGQRTVGAPEIAYVVEPEVAKWVVGDAMVAVVNTPAGTGRRARLEKWRVFGKTGTANIAKTGEKGYSNRYYVASFAAGAPAEDPAVIVLAIIRKPNRSLGLGYTGGIVAAPAVARILEKTLNYLQIPPL